jgi:hypothetical protein
MMIEIYPLNSAQICEADKSAQMFLIALDTLRHRRYFERSFRVDQMNFLVP